MGALSKADVLAAKLHRELVEVKEFGGSVYVRRMNGKQREEFITAAHSAKETQKYAALERLIVSLCVCDEAGALMFSVAELEVIDGSALAFLAKEAQRVNGLGEAKDSPAKN